tara:strand:+ start:25963 stop:27066 length:1104 start_codon:yes stop_codon:yes gene_type:complete
LTEGAGWSDIGYVRVRGVHWVGGWVALIHCGGLLFGQTVGQNAAAFQQGSAITQESYHWDSVAGDPPTPQVASTPRTVLNGANLTTLSWDPVGRPDIYQEKVIGGVSYQSTLVATFTKPYGLWDSAPGTDLTLTFDSGGSTSYIMPYVTSGDHLLDYLQETYFAPTDSPDSETVALRIQQSVGLPQSDPVEHGLAFFWVPLDHLSRPGYSGDITSQFPSLDTFPDGSYETTTVGAPDGFTYVDINDATKTYTGSDGLGEFVEWNQAQTDYPWTAMGWTYNWNFLQDGSDPALGYDPLHPDSPVALSEFVVSGGSQVLAEDWIPFADLDQWILIPEPSSFWLPFCVGWIVTVVRRRPAGERTCAKVSR